MPRPTRISHSYLQAPIDQILGQESRVRILRVLTEYEHPIPPVELAREARLDLSGVLRALETLEDTGIVLSIGVGRGRVIQFSSTHYFAPVVRNLFDAERQRRQELFDELQHVVRSFKPTPRAAWIEGPHALGRDTARDPLPVGVLVNVRDRHVTTEGLVKRLREIERRFGLTVDLVLRTRADLETLTPEQSDALGKVRPVFGVTPLQLVHASHSPPAGDATERERLGQGATRATSYDHGEEHSAQKRYGPRTHTQLDLASRRAAEAIARLLKRDPRIVERAKRWLEHRLPQASEAERHELREWAHILTMPPHRLRAFLLDPSERATRLRQTSPFLAVLTPAERDRLFNAEVTDRVARRSGGATANDG